MANLPKSTWVLTCDKPFKPQFFCMSIIPYSLAAGCSPPKGTARKLLS